MDRCDQMDDGEVMRTVFRFDLKFEGIFLSDCRVSDQIGG